MKRVLLVLIVIGLTVVGCGGDEDSPTPTQTQEPTSSTIPTPGDEVNPVANPCEQTPEGLVSLPQDDYPHEEPIEWYYWTGHLRTEEGRWFGYEQVFFLVDLAGQRMQVVNHAITDIRDQSYHYTDDIAYDASPQMNGSLLLSIGPFSASLNNGNDRLRGEVDGYAVDLELSSAKAPVLHHGDGYTDYDFGGYTYYYSRQRMETTGTITINQESYTVTGTSWFDHQWGGLTKVIDIGWDWFALQLDDSREIMLAVIHDKEEVLLSSGSLTLENCETVYLDTEEIEINASGQWTSPHTSKTYPMGWDIHVDDLDLTLTPVMADQEFVSHYKVYWEGACEVSGNATGRAYVEMTGY